ncbi:MAG: hypothetical protein V1696_03235 [Candidatus Jorgensenbacteria bacterium]
MKNWLKENWFKVGIPIAFILGMLIFGGKEEWTLMVCNGKLNDAECYSNSQVITGFESSKECFLEGASRFVKEGFECGKNCREEGHGLRVCKEICNSAGCRE